MRDGEVYGNILMTTFNGSIERARIENEANNKSGDGYDKLVKHGGYMLATVIHVSYHHT